MFAVLRFNINSSLLKIELTESALVSNINDVIIKMNALSEVGIHFSLDEFGTAYSFLQYLKMLPLNQQKMISLLLGILRQIVVIGLERTIIKMASSMNINVIAEGVETEKQRQFLLDNGGLHFEGYLFSKPKIIEQSLYCLKKFNNHIILNFSLWQSH